MGQVKADHGPGAVARLGDARHIEDLPGEKIHATDHDGGKCVAGLLDGGEHIVRVDSVVALARADLDEMRVGV